MTPLQPVEVIWDGTRVYRVPPAGEIEAIQLLADGHSTRQASKLLGLNPEGALAKATMAQNKLQAMSPADALYHLYRLEIVPDPRDEKLQPVLAPIHLDVINTVIRLGIPYDQAHKLLGLSKNKLMYHMNEMCRLLTAVNRTEVLRKAVAHGDLLVDKPTQLWRGVV